MLLEALVACAGVTLKAVATSMGIALRSGEVKAEGDLDFRGTLGVDKQAPVGFTDIRLRFELDTDAPQDQLDTLLEADRALLRRAADAEALACDRGGAHARVGHALGRRRTRKNARRRIHFAGRKLLTKPREMKINWR